MWTEASLCVYWLPGCCCFCLVCFVRFWHMAISGLFNILVVAEFSRLAIKGNLDAKTICVSDIICFLVFNYTMSILIFLCFLFRLTRWLLFLIIILISMCITMVSQCVTPKSVSKSIKLKTFIMIVNCWRTLSLNIIILLKHHSV